MNEEPLVKLYALGDIVPGKNAREEFDPVELQELADTLKSTRGALQPASGWLREDGKVELIAGERRWRAYPLAGFTEMPVMLRDKPTDQEQLLWGLIENNSRVNLKPLELARAVKGLMDLRTTEGAASYTESGLNKELGKDPNFVRRCLNLLATSKKAQEAVNTGTVDVQVAALVGSLPISCREEAEKQIIFRTWGGPMKKDEAAKHVANNFRRDLRKASFDREDDTLLPGVPKCADCPNWGGRREDVEGKGRVNVCMDPGCFEQKQQKAAEVIRRHAENDPNVKVLNNGASLFNSWDDELGYDSPYVELKASPAASMLADPKSKAPKWEKIVEESDLKVVVAFDRKGQARRLVEAKLALAAARQSEYGPMFKADAGKGIKGTDDKRQELAVTKARNAAHDECIREELGAFMECLSVPWTRSHFEQLWRLVLARDSQKDDLDMLCRVLKPDLKRIPDPGKQLNELVETLTRPEQLCALIVLTMKVRTIRMNGFKDYSVPLDLAELVEFDWVVSDGRLRSRCAAAEKQAKAEFREKTKAADKGKKPSGSTAARKPDAVEEPPVPPYKPGEKAAKKTVKPARTKERVAAPEQEATAYAEWKKNRSIEDAAAAAGVPVGTVQNWHKRRKWVQKLKEEKTLPQG